MTPGRPKIKVTLRADSIPRATVTGCRDAKASAGWCGYLGSFRRRLLRHGTAHNSKPVPSFPGLCLSACPLQCRQKEHRGRRAPPPWFNGALLALPSAGARYDQLGERRFEFIPLWGFFVFLLSLAKNTSDRSPSDISVLAMEQLG